MLRIIGNRDFRGMGFPRDEIRNELELLGKIQILMPRCSTPRYRHLALLRTRDRSGLLT